MSQSYRNRIHIVVPIKFAILGLIYVSTAAWPGPQSLSVIFNNSDATVTVNYNLRSRPGEGGTVCPLQNDESQLPRVRRGKPKGNIGAHESWEYVQGYHSIQEGCLAEFELETGFSAIVHADGACSDLKESLNGAQFESHLSRCQVLTDSGP